MNPNLIENIINKIRGQYKCPSCSSEYNLADLVVMNQANNQLMIRLNCHNCQMPVNVSVMTGQTKDKIPVGSHPLDIEKLVTSENSIVIDQSPIRPKEILDFKNFLDKK